MTALSLITAIAATLAAASGGVGPEPGSRAARPGPPQAQAAQVEAPGGTAPRPAIRQTPIVFGAKRRREMAAYSQRHYGSATWRLRAPKVIVQHYTAGTTFRSAYNTFARNVPDSELRELPATCAHFIIDRDGTIHQLVSLAIRCRHTVGLNHTAIGIEHVGRSDREILSNRRQLSASLALTRWLRCRFSIARRDVIGHNESLSSPYHHERIRRLRTQTHGDFARRSMDRYRARLGAGPC